MIKIFAPVFLIFFILSEVSAQETPIRQDLSKDYIKEVVLFLNAVKSKELNDPSFTLVNAPKYACFTYTVDDSVSFSKAEMGQIVEEIKSPKINNWKSVLPSSIRFLEASYVNSHSKSIKNPKRDTKHFEKYFGGCYANFSAPIFLRDYTFCLFYVDNICPAGKSSGELQVFEKKDGVWKQLTSRCEWSE